MHISSLLLRVLLVLNFQALDIQPVVIFRYYNYICYNLSCAPVTAPSTYASILDTSLEKHLLYTGSSSITCVSKQEQPVGRTQWPGRAKGLEVVVTHNSPPPAAITLVCWLSGSLFGIHQLTEMAEKNFTLESTNTSA